MNAGSIPPLIYSIKKSERPDNISGLEYSRKDKFVKNSNIGFEGLTSNLGKRAYSDEESIITEIENYPYANGIVGSLPSEWIEKIPQKERKDKIKTLYAELGQIFSDLKLQGRFKENNIEKASNEINKVLHDSGILFENQRVNLEKIGVGKFGTVYLLKENFDKDKKYSKYVIKLFHTVQADNNFHGTYVESNRAMYWLKNAGKQTQRARFYFADLKNGFMVSQYVDEFIEKPKKKAFPKLFGIFAYDDNISNKIGDYYVEYGGMGIINPLLTENKVARRINKKIFYTPENKRMDLWNKLYKDNNKDNDVLAGLALSIKFLPEKEHETCFEILSLRESNQVKEALAYNMKILPDNTLLEYFEQFSQNADNPVKVALIGHFKRIPINERSKYFKSFTENANNPVKIALIRKLSMLPEKERSSYFKLFAENADISVKQYLNHSLSDIPLNERAECRALI